MSSKKSHREKLARQAAMAAATDVPPNESTEAKAGAGWPRERFDADAIGQVELNGEKAYVGGRVFENEDGTVFVVWPEGSKVLGDVRISYESMPAQDATEEPVQGGSRYKRGRHWWEQSKWERSL